MAAISTCERALRSGKSTRANVGATARDRTRGIISNHSDLGAGDRFTELLGRFGQLVIAVVVIGAPHQRGDRHRTSRCDKRSTQVLHSSKLRTHHGTGRSHTRILGLTDAAEVAGHRASKAPTITWCSAADTELDGSWLQPWGDADHGSSRKPLRKTTRRTPPDRS